MFISTVFIGILLAAPVPAVDAAALKKEQEAAWADLAKEEKIASRALLKLSTRPNDTVNFLKNAMKPLIIDEVAVKKRIEELGSEDEKIWKPAFETFEYFDPRLGMTLLAAFDESKPGLARQRLVAVMGDAKAETYVGADVQLRSTGGEDEYNFSQNGGSWWAEARVSRISRSRWGTYKRYWTRAERAIVLLEHIGTPEAVAVLKSMATGHADAAPTVTAKESLKRLKAE